MGAHLAAKHPDTVLVLNSKANTGPWMSYFTTGDGIAAGGNRLADEIQAALDANPQIDRLSMIPLSLGGLYSRFALKVLEDRGVLKGLTLANFISLASPHLGVVGHLNPLIRVKQ